jgi:hypothetical protein
MAAKKGKAPDIAAKEDEELLETRSESSESSFNSAAEKWVDLAPVKELKDQSKLSMAKLAEGISTLAQNQELCFSLVEKTELNMDLVKKDVHFLATNAAEADKRMYHLEMEKVRNNVILKNLPYKDEKNKEETPAQAKEAVEDFLKKLKLDGKVKVTSARRFPAMKNAKGPAMVKATLGAGGQKALIFKNLQRLGKDSNIRVDNEYPVAMKQVFKKAEETAFEIRKNSGRKTKTKLIPKDGAVILMTMGQDEKEYKQEAIFPAKIADPELYQSIYTGKE